jgi:hypothetical protein
MIRKRILQYLELKGISKYKFYQVTGLSNGFLDKEGAIGSDKCEKICYEYPDINPVWLFIGKGSMLIDSTPVSTLEEPREQYGNTNELLKEKMAFLIEQVEFYKSKIEFLTTKLNAKKIPEGKELEEGLKIIDKIEEELSKKFS